MTRALSTAALAWLLLAPGPAVAQLVLGAAGGAAFPTGDGQQGEALSDDYARAYPLELRAGWQLTPALVVGVAGAWGAASAADAWSGACGDAGITCTAHLWRIAARGEYTLGAGTWRPFAALHAGWEWDVRRQEADGGNWEQVARAGWLAGLEAGIDRALTPGFQAGAFVGYAMGQYRSAKITGQVLGYDYEDSGEIPSPTLHGWFGLGLRGRFAF